MSDSLLILGRQPALGLAELESLYGADMVRSAGKEAALLSVEPSNVDFLRLGGSVKLCKVVDTFDTVKWPDIQRSLERLAPQVVAGVPEGKIQLGISAYGLGIRPQQLVAAGLTIKKAVRASGRSVRLVPNQEPALNSAQVLHNKLTGDNGCEVVIVRNGNQTICAQTVAEQDIESYTLRDRGRPKRDARVGMLPPKLAQIIINLAVGSNRPDGQIILDPFCGTGVVLLEAMLMGYTPYGTDLEPRMIEYSHANLKWLREHFHLGLPPGRLEQGDATTHNWDNIVQFVAGEAYLGRPFTSQPNPEVLSRTVSDVNLILIKFLQNIQEQLPESTRLCLAVPAWQIAPDKFKHLPLIDRLSDLGYNRVRFEHVPDEQLLYYREDQIVARELIVLTRK
jgi:tRNA G10  N-methylase Trm11